MTWPKVALSEVATLTWRGEAPNPDQTYRLVGVRWWGEGAYEYKTVLGSETQAPQLYRVEAGDLLINKIWARHGSIAVADDSLAGAYGSSEFPTFILDRERLEPRFAHWFSKTTSAWAQCEALSRGTSGKNRVKPERFLTVKIPLPPLAEQRRIVAQLEAAAAAMSARMRAAGEVESELAATLAAAFDRITQDTPRSTMGEVAPLVRRPVTIDPDATYPELGVRSFGKGTFHKPPLTGIDVGSKRLFSIEPADLVFNIVFAWEGAIAVAEASDAGRVGSHRFLSCVPDPSVATATFLRYWFLSEEGLLALGRASPGGAGRNRTLGIKALEAIRVPVPSLDAQHWFDHLQAKVRAARVAQAAATTELDALLPALLHDVFGDADARD
ncbi:type I restriction enzyme, S subunit [Sphingomonas sp. OV641]|uniref:restriction endonuclease subunit S n=1 Tax=Sphingomonas sp. OV641 TaxID=1881068 RepID=UPI0008CF2407|nr:restriction endonuclease subunit S [Sphingomonas sp. OV641]SEK02040.1 type I restriction enzyme, S subunit [Sphingomonas sp. OV641]